MTYSWLTHDLLINYSCVVRKSTALDHVSTMCIYFNLFACACTCTLCTFTVYIYILSCGFLIYSCTSSHATELFEESLYHLGGWHFKSGAPHIRAADQGHSPSHQLSPSQETVRSTEGAGSPPDTRGDLPAIHIHCSLQTAAEHWWGWTLPHVLHCVEEGGEGGRERLQNYLCSAALANGCRSADFMLNQST